MKKIIIDTREQKEERQYFIDRDIPYSLESLPCGDYAAEDRDGNRVVIERKEIKDLLQSAFSGRLDEQMKKLSSEQLPILVVTGGINEYYEAVPDSKFTRDQLYGMFGSIIVRYGIRCLIWHEGVNAHEEGLGIIYKICHKVAESKLDKIPMRKTREFSNRVGFLRILLNCPEDVARKLIKKYSSIMKIVSLNDKELLKNKGIGPLRVKRLREIMGNG